MKKFDYFNNILGELKMGSVKTNNQRFEEFINLCNCNNVTTFTKDLAIKSTGINRTSMNNTLKHFKDRGVIKARGEYRYRVYYITNSDTQAEELGVPKYEDESWEDYVSRLECNNIRNRELTNLDVLKNFSVVKVSHTEYINLRIGTLILGGGRGCGDYDYVVHSYYHLIFKNSGDLKLGRIETFLDTYSRTDREALIMYILNSKNVLELTPSIMGKLGYTKNYANLAPLEQYALPVTSESVENVAELGKSHNNKVNKFKSIFPIIYKVQNMFRLIFNLTDNKHYDKIIKSK